jgi:hypothetical protein
MSAEQKHKGKISPPESLVARIRSEFFRDAGVAADV